MDLYFAGAAKARAGGACKHSRVKVFPFAFAATGLAAERHRSRRCFELNVA